MNAIHRLKMLLYFSATLIILNVCICGFMLCLCGIFYAIQIFSWNVAVDSHSLSRFGEKICIQMLMRTRGMPFIICAYSCSGEYIQSKWSIKFNFENFIKCSIWHTKNVLSSSSYRQQVERGKWKKKCKEKREIDSPSKKFK